MNIYIHIRRTHPRCRGKQRA